MVDYSHFVFQDRDHSYGYAQEVCVGSGADDHYAYGEQRQLCYRYRFLASSPEESSDTADICQDLPLNLSLNPHGKADEWGGSMLAAAATHQHPSAEIEPAAGCASVAGDPNCPPAAAVPVLGGEFILSDLGAHIAQEEIVESELVYEGEEEEEEEEEDEEEEDEEEEDEEEEDGSGEEENESVLQAYSQEASRNSSLRLRVNDLTKKIARIRTLLEAEAKKEKVSVQPSTSSFQSRMSMHPFTTEPDLEIKSESELETSELMPGVRAMKRSRNQSWPQMLDSNARKKEQNKMASKRFRERKKQELEKAKLEIHELEARNQRLRHRANKMQQEADNLKQVLLRLNLIRIMEYDASGNSKIQKI